MSSATMNAGNPLIRIETATGEFLRAILSSDASILFHRRFGLVTRESLTSRISRRENRGLKDSAEAAPVFGFDASVKNGILSVSGTAHCKAEKAGENAFRLETPRGTFFVKVAADAAPALAQAYSPQSAAEKDRVWKILLAAGMLFSIAIGLVPRGERAAVEPEILEPVTVKILPVEPQKVVVVAGPTLIPEMKTQNQQVRRAVQQNLGFLGVVGKKDLSKALGGVPTQLKDASAGAGPGGKGGSGGEFLTGLGEGLKRATVGNTGVAGLGGVKTAIGGPGGGAGGYGNARVASGEGRALSTVATSNELVLEGGLDRSVIQATIAKYLAQVRACYEDGLQRNSSLAGQVGVQFSVGATGSVVSSQLGKSTLGDSAVENCIVSRVKDWKFPKPVGGVTVKVSYPFILRPVGGA